MSKSLVAWTPKIEKLAKQERVKTIKHTLRGKHFTVLVAFGPEAKQRVRKVILESKVGEYDLKKEPAKSVKEPATSVEAKESG